jgi:DNA-binding IclR family transcriptional regulator
MGKIFIIEDTFTDMSNSTNSVQSAVMTMRIIEALSDLDNAGVSEVADYLNKPTSTVYNYLSTLESNSYLVRDQDNNYQVATRLLEISEYIKERHDIYDIGKPEVEELAEETGEIAHLLIEEHGKGVYIYVAKGENAVRVDTYAGKRVHLHNTALGKAILAHLPKDRVDEIVDCHGLPESTKNTITDRGALEEELEQIREQGVAFDREERALGLNCVAAPIKLDDQILGGISVSGPKRRIHGNQLEEEIPEQLRNSVNIIEVNSRYS